MQSLERAGYFARKEGTAMDMKTIYVIDHDTLSGTYEKIPLCFKKRQFFCVEVESIPKEKEILLLRRNGALMSMAVFKVVYYEWKIFVIVDHTEDDQLQSMESEYEGMKSREAVSKLAGME